MHKMIRSGAWEIIYPLKGISGFKHSNIKYLILPFNFILTLNLPRSDC